MPLPASTIYVCVGKTTLYQKLRCPLLIPSGPVGSVHHPWENRTKPKQLTWWAGGFLCIWRTHGRPWRPVCRVPGEAPGFPTTIRGALHNILSKMKAPFCLSWISLEFMRREYVCSCSIQPSFYSCSVRTQGETGLETWLSHARGFCFMAGCYISIVFNIKLFILGSYGLQTSWRGAIIQARFNFCKQLVHTGNTAFFLLFSGFVSMG